MCGVLEIENGRGKNIYTYVHGIVSTVPVVTRKTIAKGCEAGEDQVSRW